MTPDFVLNGRLPDGSPVSFRPIRPADKRSLQDALLRMSPGARYRRFQGPVDRLTEAQLRYFTELDFVDHVAWVAATQGPEGEVGIAVGRWVRLADDPEAAEVALTVIDPCQRAGIGRTLLWLLIATGIARGLKRFVTSTTAENEPVRHLLAAHHATLGGWRQGVQEASVPLPASLEALSEMADGPWSLPEAERLYAWLAAEGFA